MFDDPGKTAEDNMNNALGCGLVGMVVAFLFVVGLIVLVVRAL